MRKHATNVLASDLLLPHAAVGARRLCKRMHASEFLQANASSLDLCKGSRTYAFKRLQLADAAGLTDACKACADRIMALNRSSCILENT
jgi:hypothetical protein